MNIAYNIDCMEYMKTLPDKYFDLAVVDPPYGGGAAETENGGQWRTPNPEERGRFGGRFDKYHIATPPTTDGLSAPDIKAERRGCCHNKYNIKCHRASNPGGSRKAYAGNDIRHWDIAPTDEYFRELARVSKNQIIWGGNYFALPPTRCFLVWRKLTISENFTMAMAEYAWTSFNGNAKVFEAAPQDKSRFHPTQKPVSLYEWIFRLYAKPGDKILDTHLGSGSSRIAAYNAGLDFVGCEIDKYYFDKQEERFDEYIKQPSIFTMQEEYKQGDLFE